MTTRKELLQSSGEKIWGSFAREDIAYELDRKKLNPNQPSLAEMTEKAIQTLSKNDKGFFCWWREAKSIGPPIKTIR